jgi:hypothetical protein
LKKKKQEDGQPDEEEEGKVKELDGEEGEGEGQGKGQQEEGGLVISYGDLIEYYLERDSNVRVDYLKMDGRNKVVYRL